MKKLILCLSLLIFNYSLSIAAVRFVSHSGSSIPPYLTWETAADSIMSAVNISSFGDTIYVANGVYKEVVDMINGLTLIGAGSDSCIIDTRDLQHPPGFHTIEVFDTCMLSGFGAFSYDVQNGTGILITGGRNTVVRYCRVEYAAEGITINGPFQCKPLVYKNIVQNIDYGISNFFSQAIVTDNIIYANGISYGLVSGLNSRATFINNTVICSSCSEGYGGAGSSISKVKNNLFYGSGITGGGIVTYGDTVWNNVVYNDGGYWGRGITGTASDIRNNNIENALKGMVDEGGTPPEFQYNNLWDNQTNYQNFTADSTNIYADPMFNNPDSLDFHLQKYSPLIDAGDPNILDKDGSRSDIGLFGGPYGEKYTYQDLAPKPPSNLTAVIDSGLVLLRWNRNTEADFYRYRVYRDTVPDFMYDSTRMIAVTADTFYYDDLPEKYLAKDYYYKITAIDSAGHQSAPGEEVQVNITGVPEGPPKVVERFQLLNNYPNPFNSSTIIPYRLKEPGYVKLYVYDVKGELVRILVNQYQQAGYYEVRFNPTSSERRNGELGEGWPTGYNDDIATGIYLYQIMVRGEGNIPVFTGMGKMILLK